MLNNIKTNSKSSTNTIEKLGKYTIDSRL